MFGFKKNSLSLREIKNFRQLMAEKDTLGLKDWLSNKERLSKKSDMGWTPLIYAIEAKSMEAIHLILEEKRKGEVNIKGNAGSEALMFAIFNFKESIPLLLKAGANPNSRDEYKNTALICAAKLKKTDTFWQLIEAGADPEETFPLIGSKTGLSDVLSSFPPGPSKDEFEVWLNHYLLNKAIPPTTHPAAVKYRL